MNYAHLSHTVCFFGSLNSTSDKFMHWTIPGENLNLNHIISFHLSYPSINGQVETRSIAFVRKSDFFCVKDKQVHPIIH